MSMSHNLKYSVMLQLVAHQATHVHMFCEAEGLDIAQKMIFPSFRMVCSEDRNMAIMARVGEDGEMNILYDSTSLTEMRHRDYQGDPTERHGVERTLWYMIVEIRFGRPTDPDGEDP